MYVLVGISMLLAAESADGAAILFTSEAITLDRVVLLVGVGLLDSESCKMQHRFSLKSVIKIEQSATY